MVERSFIGRTRVSWAGKLRLCVEEWRNPGSVGRRPASGNPDSGYSWSPQSETTLALQPEELSAKTSLQARRG